VSRSDEEIAQLFESLFAIARFDLKPGQNAYVYFSSKSNADLYCYTPHPDIHGCYHVWTYTAVGRGARQRKTAKRWRMTDHEVLSSRRSARSEALRRYHES
jgi:hypothetical protein